MIVTILMIVGIVLITVAAFYAIGTHDIRVREKSFWEMEGRSLLYSSQIAEAVAAQYVNRPD